MPFSWKKKTRCNRFSKLVADHLQSTKRGSSLVVETGFPTSLIDLYVRNRGRFRKSEKKKQRDVDSPIEVSSCSSSPSSGLMVDLKSLSSGDLDDYEGIDEIVEDDVVVGVSTVADNCESNNFDEIEVGMSADVAKLNRVVAVVMAVFVMAVLVLGTKRFTVGITVSAFVLVLMELVGKRLFGRAKARSGIGFEEMKNVSKENVSRVCSEVMEIEEEEVVFNQEVRSEKELDKVRSEVVMEIRRRSSRRAIMKSRMKKLVPKKLRKSSMGSKEEISLSYGLNEQEIVRSLSNECLESKSETLRVLKQNQDKIREIEGRSLSSCLSSELDCNDKELRGLGQKYGCSVLCLVVLVGLIGGWVLAFVLALSWCLMLKKLRNVKFPIS